MPDVLKPGQDLHVQVRHAVHMLSARRHAMHQCEICTLSQWPAVGCAQAREHALANCSTRYSSTLQYLEPHPHHPCAGGLSQGIARSRQ